MTPRIKTVLIWIATCFAIGVAGIVVVLFIAARSLNDVAAKGSASPGIAAPGLGGNGVILVLFVLAGASVLAIAALRRSKHT